MKRGVRSGVLLLLLCVLTVLWSLGVAADFGPKPSIHVQFEHMGDERCYGTLLSKTESTGPASVWDGNEAHIYDNGLEREIWRAFAEYADADGYYFLQWGWQVNETKELSWGYYPPSAFKVLLYYPDTGRFAVSGVCEKYAFDSYYTVDMRGGDLGEVRYDEAQSGDERLVAFKTENTLREAGALLARMAVTVALELGIALLFGWRRARQVWFVAGVNVGTQVGLNLLLWVLYRQAGQTAFFAGYAVLELLVFAVEAWLYGRFMNRWSDRPCSKKRYAMYALVANAASFLAGIVLIRLWPEWF